MRELVVWGGMLMTAFGQCRCIVATRTKKKACELLDLPRDHFNTYWSDTGNAVELAVARATPETVFIQKTPHVKVFEPYNGRL